MTLHKGPSTMQHSTVQAAASVFNHSCETDSLIGLPTGISGTFLIRFVNRQRFLTTSQKSLYSTQPAINQLEDILTKLCSHLQLEAWAANAALRVTLLILQSSHILIGLAFNLTTVVPSPHASLYYSTCYSAGAYFILLSRNFIPRSKFCLEQNICLCNITSINKDWASRHCLMS